MMKFIIALSVILIGIGSVFGQNGLNRDLQKAFKRYELVKLRPTDLKGKADASQRIQLRAYGRNFDFDLTPHDIRAANYRAVETNTNGDYELSPGK